MSSKGQPFRTFIGQQSTCEQEQASTTGSMVQVDIEGTDNSSEGVSIDSLEKSKCNAITFCTAVVTSIARRFVTFVNTSNKSSSTTDDIPSRHEILTPVGIAQPASHRSIVKPRHYRVSNIPDSTVSEDYRTSKSTSSSTQSTSASYDDIFRYAYNGNNEEDQVHELETISTVSYVPKNQSSTVELSSANFSTKGKAKSYTDRGTINSVQSTAISMTRTDGMKYRNVRSCSELRSSKLLRVSAKVLKLPRDIEFDSSCNSSIDEDDHNLSCDL